jgi:hypothetical protein
MKEHSFDIISKEMADSTISRGKALKLVGAAILGGAFAGLLPGTAQARRTSNRRRTLVFCGTGSFNFLNNCTNSAGKQFSCSSNFVGLGGSVTCNSGGTRYACNVTNNNGFNNGFGGVTLSCKQRNRRRR